MEKPIIITLDNIQENGCLSILTTTNGQNHREALCPGQFDHSKKILPDNLYQKICEIWTDEVVEAYQMQQRKQQDQWASIQPQASGPLPTELQRLAALESAMLEMMLGGM